MSFVFVDMYLQGRYTKALLAKISKMLQLFHCGIFLADDHTFTQGSTTGNLHDLSCLLVYPFSFFSLHCSASLFPDHTADGIVILLQGVFSLLFREPRAILGY